MDKKILLLGLISYTILAVLALLFYVERIAILDASYQLFSVIRTGDFAIQNFRFGAFFTQSFPLIGSKLNFALPNVMKLYSLSFVFLHATIFVLTLVWTKSSKFGVVVMLFSIFITTHTFYWIQSELIQGLVLLLLFFSYIQYAFSNVEAIEKTNFWGFSASMVFIFFLVFIHPLVVFPFLFLAGFFYLHNTVNKQVILNLCAAYIVVFIFKTIFFRVAYDSSAIGGLRNFLTLFPDYFSLTSNKNFIRYIFSDYYLIPISFILLIYFYIKKQDFKKLSLFLVFFMGYLLLINVTQAKGAEQFYIESLYLPLSIMLIVPLVFDVKKILPNKYWLPVLVLVVSVRLIHIGLTHQTYTTRVNYLQTYVEEYDAKKTQKLIVDASYFSKDILKLTWASPYEFWLLSTIYNGKTQSILISEKPEELAWAIPTQDAFVTPWGVFKYEDFPERYFNFQDANAYVLQTRDDKIEKQ